MFHAPHNNYLFLKLTSRIIVDVTLFMIQKKTEVKKRKKNRKDLITSSDA